MKFDGKAYAQEIENQVSGKVSKLAMNPRIVSVLVGDDPASALYTKLKKAAAERVGIEFEIAKIDSLQLTASSLLQKITEIGEREDVTGVMVQLPLPADFKGETPKVLSAIPMEKDVDGLRYPESGVVPPVVMAVMKVLGEIARRKSSDHSPTIAQGSELWNKKFVVVGAKGFVGSALCHELQKRGVEAVQVESDTPEPARTVLAGEVVISCVGKEGVITEDMVRDSAILIDVGSPRGDMTDKAYQKASVSVEVPGGVGPVTIACLLENDVEMYGNKLSGAGSVARG